MLAKEIKNGSIVNYNNAPCLIQSVNVQTPTARGAATLYKFRARNLLTKQKIDITLKGTEALQESNFERRDVKFMYSDPEYVHFLDQTDFNQHSLHRDDVSEELQYLTEDLEEVQVMIYNDEPVGLQVPQTVHLKVVECDPAVKGNSATSRTKPAKLETGLVVQVPEYLAEGETVKVDTRTGQYLSRA